MRMMSHVEAQAEEHIQKLRAELSSAAQSAEQATYHTESYANALHQQQLQRVESQAVESHHLQQQTAVQQAISSQQQHYEL